MIGGEILANWLTISGCLCMMDERDGVILSWAYMSEGGAEKLH